jgi:hypothetical protein
MPPSLLLLVAMASAATWYADEDGDGYGDATNTVEADTAPTGYVADATDCDDGDAAVNPGATEVCNGTDDDCDGVEDDSPSDGDTFYQDLDGDGFGTTAATATGCRDAPAGYADSSDDCDDANAAVNPREDEVCDGVDNDCDGTIDVVTWYADADGDGLGDASTATTGCEAPAGYVDNPTTVTIPKPRSDRPRRTTPTRTATASAPRTRASRRARRSRAPPARVGIATTPTPR